MVTHHNNWAELAPWPVGERIQFDSIGVPNWGELPPAGKSRLLLRFLGPLTTGNVLSLKRLGMFSNRNFQCIAAQLAPANPTVNSLSAC